MQLFGKFGVRTKSMIPSLQSNSNSVTLESQRDLDSWNIFQNLLYSRSMDDTYHSCIYFRYKNSPYIADQKLQVQRRRTLTHFLPYCKFWEGTIHLKRCLWVNRSLKYQVSSRFDKMAAFGDDLRRFRPSIPRSNI